MKQLLPKFWAKFVAGLLFVVMTALCLAAVTGVAVLADGGAYADGGTRLRENALFSQVYQNVDIVADYYGAYQSAQELGEKTETLSYYESRFAKENSNYFFTITDADGNELPTVVKDADGKEVPAVTINFAEGTAWFQGTDGAWYYCTALAPGETTAKLFETVTFAPELGNEYQGCTAQVIVTAQAVQTANNPIPDGGTAENISGWPAA